MHHCSNLNQKKIEKNHLTGLQCLLNSTLHVCETQQSCYLQGFQPSNQKITEFPEQLLMFWKYEHLQWLIGCVVLYSRHLIWFKTGRTCCWLCLWKNNRLCQLVIVCWILRRVNLNGGMDLHCMTLADLNLLSQIVTQTHSCLLSAIFYFYIPEKKDKTWACCLQRHLITYEQTFFQ